MKIDGLKEIEAYFPPQEDKTPFKEELEILEENNDREIEEEISKQEINELQDKSIENPTLVYDEITEIETPQDEFIINAITNNETDSYIIEEDFLSKTSNKQRNKNTNEKENNSKFSLLGQIFKNKAIKKETSYLLHVVKDETSYDEIAKLYNIDENSIKKVNNDEGIYKGKLLFIPKN